jgi:redox-sensitive bicupin YhaK (pirin superfamily)
MIELRPFATLGHADHGWLDARHHFSFASYRDAARMNWGRLRVWNDDAIAPGSGFDPHPHRDMEIVTFVREGAITHRDDLGNEGRTEAGDVQIMSAGTGIVHAEYNLEPVTTRIFQIWIIPDRAGGAPRWGSRRFPKDGRAARFEILASGRAADAGGDALPINADAAVLAAALAPGRVLRHVLAPDRIAYLVPAVGEVTVNGVTLGTRDGLAIRDEAALEIVAATTTELVMVEAAAS